MSSVKSVNFSKTELGRNGQIVSGMSHEYLIKNSIPVSYEAAGALFRIILSPYKTWFICHENVLSEFQLKQKMVFVFFTFMAVISYYLCGQCFFFLICYAPLTISVLKEHGDCLLLCRQLDKLTCFVLLAQWEWLWAL